MPQGNSFPAIDAGVETVTGTFDFGPSLLSGVAVSSINSVTCVVETGVDSAASLRLIGSPQTGTSPATGAPNAAVLQQWGTMLAGVTYRMMAVVTTSDGQTLDCWAYQPCQAIT